MPHREYPYFDMSPLATVPDKNGRTWTVLVYEGEVQPFYLASWKGSPPLLTWRRFPPGPPEPVRFERFDNRVDAIRRGRTLLNEIESGTFSGTASG